MLSDIRPSVGLANDVSVSLPSLSLVSLIPTNIILVFKLETNQTRTISLLQKNNVSL